MANVPVVRDRFAAMEPSSGLVCGDSMTHQEFKDECDINRIMDRAMKTGVFPPSVDVGRYGDFSDVGDFQEANELLSRVREQFAGLPAKVRDKFENDASKFLAWIDSKDFNLEDAHDMGILKEESSSKIIASRAAKAKAAEEDKILLAEAKAAKAAASAAVPDKK